MKQYLFGFIILPTIISCNNQTPKAQDYSEIAFITNKLEQKDLDNSIQTFSNVSVMAKKYIKALPAMETKAKELKSILEKQETISSQLQEDFIDTFRMSLEYIGPTDSSTLQLLKTTPIKSSEDIDQLLLFMKRIFVKQISYAERYLFNVIGTSAETRSLNIKNGEPFSMNMNITAANSNTPAEWFLLKDDGSPLVKENITDTLHPDEHGNILITTTKYSVGENRITVAVKIPSTHDSVTLYKSVDFTVH